MSRYPGFGRPADWEQAGWPNGRRTTHVRSANDEYPD